MNNQEVKRYFAEYILPPRGFIYSDIQREINLARSGDSGGNFLAALGLLCYTEFMGRILLKGKKASKKCYFNEFFCFMGEPYKQLTKGINVYGKFRCEMAHTYFVRNCDIRMLNDSYPAGIIIQPDDRYLFVVEKYHEDFVNACKRLYDQMIQIPNPYLPST